MFSCFHFLQQHNLGVYHLLKLYFIIWTSAFKTFPSSSSNKLSSDIRNTLVAKTGQTAVERSAAIPRSLIWLWDEKLWHFSLWGKTLFGPGGLWFPVYPMRDITQQLCFKLDTGLLGAEPPKLCTLEGFSSPVYGLVPPKLYGSVGASSWPMKAGGRTLLKYSPATLFTRSHLALQAEISPLYMRNSRLFEWFMGLCEAINLLLQLNATVILFV